MIKEEVSNLHNRAFSFLGPRIIFLIDSMNKGIVFFVFLYEFAHPGKGEKDLISPGGIIINDICKLP
jgi:hypothetical protein